MNLKRNYDNAEPSHIIYPHTHTIDSVDKNTQEYEVLLEYNLKRQKQKNLILEERLKNKELFIQQIKHFQEELTLAYEKCKNQLIQAHQKIQYLQKVQFREYTEQISDLKHMLMRKSSGRRDSLHQHKEEKIKQPQTQHQRINRVKSQKNIGNKKYTSRKQSYPLIQDENYQQGSQLATQIQQEFKKAVNFINHFLQMAKIYNEGIEEEQKVTHKLKKSWKWIKDVVKEWDLQKQKLDKFQLFKASLRQFCSIYEDCSLDRILLALRNNFESNRQSR